MSRILKLREKAKENKRLIVLPEGNDNRVVKAASFIVKEGIADIILLGKKEEVEKIAQQEGVSLEGVQLIDPETHDKKDDVVNAFYERRKAKGITPEEALKTVMEIPVYYAAVMTSMELADGFVAGASHTTSTVVRASLQCLRLDREIGTASSSFIMELDDCPFGEDGLFIFGDCGVVPYPSARQLAGIAISTSDLFKNLFGKDPRVALLSYSTKGSATGDSIDNIHAALERIKAKRPNLLVDGELQLDSAIVPEVAERKCPDSEIGGRANILIFPNLDAGNISYKLAQRLGKARAVGPIMQGLSKPCSDLSRGCSTEDVIDAVSVVSILASGKLVA
jgi:phosphate acetyltransferase